jgi:F-type H+-transporting ATPase subunit epsilon
VQPDRVIVLADVAERADEIDLARAEEARRRAEEMVKDRPAGVDIEKALSALRRAQIRVAVAQKRGGRRADVPGVKSSNESQG